jgi:hypothetical protein
VPFIGSTDGLLLANEVVPDRRQAGSLSYNAFRSVEAMSQGHVAAVVRLRPAKRGPDTK